ncbi:probable receptor-like serine/threonine-protein kinase At4g34500 [Typha angustifolia]|uniref:probable receptor-like serine/threonine-protein kinase At4g34500 n=1 Tax=Typha angustifolia TaxID=59011 RepID=UPI003C2B2E23
MGSLPFLGFLLLFPHLFVGAWGSAEVRALMEVKSALDPDGRVLGSWTNDGDPCRGDFEGVACNEHGKVANISLQGKGLSGTISPAVAGLRCLSGLYLHYNKLNGGIPREIGNLTELTDLYLNVNNLSGSIPVEISKMDSLQVLQLCYNRLTGSIPTQLGLLKKLTVLALQSNLLTGAIPATLGDLTQLMRLDLSFNRLFGSIPKKLVEIPVLTVLDLRNNSLSGSVPSGLTRLNGGFQFGNNTGLCGVGFDALKLCPADDALKPNKPEPFSSNSVGLKPQQIPQSANFNAHCNGSHCSKSSKTSAGIIIVGIVAVAIGGTFFGLFALMWYRRRKQKIGSSLEVSDSRLSTDQPKDAYRKSASPLISLEYANGWDPLSDGRSGVGFSQEVSQSFRFNLEEVECATQYFSDVNLLGKSNFAATYKGILRDGSVVAVKSINKTSCKTEEADFLKGLKILTLLRHENLVSLRGFCCSRGRGECFLVYDYMTNGSLSQYLDVKDNSSGRILDWATRVSIIKGIAKGIDYLHSNRANKPSLVHQSISSEKILIDHHFTPRISGSGLHKLLADDVVFSTLKASAARGYLSPEYTTVGRFTEKSDVYAFGVILFQILTGKRTVSHLLLSSEFGNLEDILDQNLNGNFLKPEAAKLAGIALLCTSEIPSQRPTMEAVLQQLNSSC